MLYARTGSARTRTGRRGKATALGGKEVRRKAEVRRTVYPSSFSLERVRSTRMGLYPFYVGDDGV